jgi:tetratricopeptide (TPR) repeat protein
MGGPEFEAVDRTCQREVHLVTRDRITYLLDQGEAALAYDMIEGALEAEGADTHLLELKFRALRALGAEAEAEELIGRLIEQGHETRETLGLHASHRKKQAFRERDAHRMRAGLEEALELYQRAASRFERRDGWYHVNIATLSQLLGREREARAAATEALREVRGVTPAEAGEQYGWVLGTRGEAPLVLGREDEAVDAYLELVAFAHEHEAWEMVGSARNNARMLLRGGPGLVTVEANADRVEAALATPPVVICVGHMVDLPGRRPARFPPDLVGRAREAIEAFVERHGPSYGYGSLACGTDILFHEVLAEREVPRFAVLPFPRDDFVRQSVARDDDCGWAERFERLWESSARRTEVAPDAFEWEALCYDFANEVTIGLALLRADELETDVVGFALWDERAGDGPGGTESVIRLWRARESPLRVEVVSPRALAAGRTTPEPFEKVLAARSQGPRDALGEEGAAVMALLFADAKGYSGLGEVGADVFASRFLGILADVVDRFRGEIFEANTWGDGLFFALTNVESAGRLALALGSAVEETRPSLLEAGLPESMGLRLALHAAPVRLVHDRIRDQVRVSGAQVSKAARIEPVTPPGRVYASEAFAALSRARSAEGYRCRYVGVKSLAKDYGRHPLYVVEGRPG